MAVGGGGRPDVELVKLWQPADQTYQPEHSHFPYARRVRHGWLHADDGRWTWTSEDPHLWEVVCAQCGDTGDPAEEQSPEVRHLRGPYATEHHARRVASRHYRAM